MMFSGPCLSSQQDVKMTSVPAEATPKSVAIICNDGISEVETRNYKKK
jgi:hypothetical protein